MKFYPLLIILFLVSATKNNKQVIASYDVKPELFWLEENKYTGVLLEDSSYVAIYYEPISKKYYFATLQLTNNISYNTNNLKDENQYINYKSYSKVSLTYIGSANLTNRFYIDTNGQHYMKSLKLINDDIYIDDSGNLIPLETSVLPYARYHSGDCGDVYKAIFYTNNLQIDFYRNLFIPEDSNSKYPFSPLREYKDPSHY
ncbi:MAG: hypothetical protein ACRCV0_01770 [Brevinema sp.]